MRRASSSSAHARGLIRYLTKFQLSDVGNSQLQSPILYALQGEKRKALAALRRAIDEGWRVFWSYYLKRDPNLESLHDEPEFQAMAKENEADMAAQLARVLEMERAGEFVAIPRTEVSLH